MGSSSNASTSTQYARFIEGTQEPGYSKHLLSWVNEDPNILTGSINELQSLVHAFRNTAQRIPNNKFLGRRDEKVEGRPYIWINYREGLEYVNNLARGIKALNMMEDIHAEGKKWNFMGIYAKNRPEWVLTDLAAATLGGTTVAFYDTLGPQAIEFVIKQTELTSIACAAQQLSTLILLKNQGKANSIKFLISFDEYDISIQKEGLDAGIQVMHINEVIEHGKKHQKLDLDANLPKFDDIWMFCYTSGTTGDPKAAMLSHGNLLSSASAVFSVGGGDFTERDTMISYLPLAHSFEKCLFTCCVISGMSIGYYSGDALKLLEDLQELKPTLFPSVPRLYNRIYDKISQGIKQKSGTQQLIVQRAVASKLKNLALGGHYTHSVYDPIVFNKMKSLLGGKVRVMITGSAPISSDVLNFLKICFCAPICEGYGLTESSAAASLTSAFDPVAGHVGGPLSCIRVRLRDIPEMSYLSTDENPRGEIMFQGNSIFKGYYKNEEKTNEALINGWLATGDVGMVFPNGSIKVIDRAKNIFKLSQGEYIAPEKLENIYIQSPYIAQIYVHGDSLQSWLVAVIVPEFSQLKALAEQKNLIGPDDDVKNVLNHKDLHQAVLNNMLELAKVNKLSGLEKVKKIYFASEPMTIENDILTPTMKIKRNVAKVVYKQQIEDMYAEPLE